METRIKVTICRENALWIGNLIAYGPMKIALYAGKNFAGFPINFTLVICSFTDADELFFWQMHESLFHFNIRKKMVNGVVQRTAAVNWGEHLRARCIISSNNLERV